MEALIEENGLRGVQVLHGRPGDALLLVDEVGDAELAARLEGARVGGGDPPVGAPDSSGGLQQAQVAADGLDGDSEEAGQVGDRGAALSPQVGDESLPALLHV